MPGLDALLELGGPFALIGAMIIALKYGVDAINAWRSSRPTKVPAINDAAATNALLLSALRSERENGAEKDRRIALLESEMGILRKMLYEQSDNYEAELSELRRVLNDARNRIAGLERRLPGGNNREG